MRGYKGSSQSIAPSNGARGISSQSIGFALSHGNGTTKSARDRTNDGHDSVEATEVVAASPMDPCPINANMTRNGSEQLTDCRPCGPFRWTSSRIAVVNSSAEVDQLRLVDKLKRHPSGVISRAVSRRIATLMAHTDD